MRYVLLLYTNEADRPAWGTSEGDAEAKAYEAFHGEITRRGLQSGEPLLRVAEAKSVRVRDGKAQVTDGPAVQTPEQLGGYYLVDGKDLDEALELAAKVPGARYGTIEVRPRARARLASTEPIRSPTPTGPQQAAPHQHPSTSEGFSDAFKRQTTSETDH